MEFHWSVVVPFLFFFRIFFFFFQLSHLYFRILTTKKKTIEILEFKFFFLFSLHVFATNKQDTKSTFLQMNRIMFVCIALPDYDCGRFILSDHLYDIQFLSRFLYIYFFCFHWYFVVGVIVLFLLYFVVVFSITIVRFFSSSYNRKYTYSLHQNVYKQRQMEN